MRTSIRFASQQIALLENLNLDIDRCLQDTGMSRADMVEQGTYVEEDRLQRFYRNIVEEYGDPFLGILMGENFTLNYTGYLGLALMSAPTLNEAIQITIDHPQLSGIDLQYGFEVSTTEFRVTLSGNRNDRNDLFTFFCNYNLAGVFKSIREILDSRVLLNHVALMHGDRARASDYERHFGCDVSFEAQRNEMVLPFKYLHQVLPRADGHAFEMMRERCTVIERQRNQDHSFRTRVEQILFTTDSEVWCVEAVASRLNVSPRTLKRKLESEGTSFSTMRIVQNFS